MADGSVNTDGVTRFQRPAKSRVLEIPRLYVHSAWDALWHKIYRGFLCLVLCFYLYLYCWYFLFYFCWVFFSYGLVIAEALLTEPLTGQDM